MAWIIHVVCRSKHFLLIFVELLTIIVETLYITYEVKGYRVQWLRSKINIVWRNLDHRLQGRIQDFKLGGAHLKKLRRAEGGAKFLGYFVWKITILRQKIIFFPIAERGAKICGVFRVKNHDFTPKNLFFSNFRGARAGCAPLWIRPWVIWFQGHYGQKFKLGCNRQN